MSLFDFLKRFWAWALSLLALVGGYVGLQEAELGWIIVVVAAAAVVLALLKPLGEAWSKVRRYPTLVNRVQTLEEAEAKARREADDLRSQATTEFDRGVEEGRKEILGAYLAANGGPAPQLVAVGRDEQRVTLAARIEEGATPRVGARYDLRVSATGDRKGVLEVVLVDVDAGLVHLECVKAESAEFWAALAQRASAEPTPPAGLQLVAAEFSLPTPLQGEGNLTFDL